MDYKIPFSAVGHRIEEEYIDKLKDLANSGKTYTQGFFQEKFEEDFKNYINTGGFCLATSNAVSALEMIADEIKISSHDEIICTSHTYCASLYPFLRANPTVKWADIDKDSWLSEADQIDDKVTESTRLIIIVHLYGTPSDCTSLYSKWRNKGIVIVEDCAQALGARINNRHVGTLSDYSVFSFQSHKNISTLGEGGMLVVKDKSKKTNFKLNRHNGHAPYDIHHEMYWKPAMTNVVRIPKSDHFPHNYCLNEFACCIGSSLLSDYDGILRKKEKNYHLLKQSIDSNQELAGKLKYQLVADNKNISFHLFPLQLSTMTESNVDRLFLTLSEAYGIQCAKQYMPLYKYDLFSPTCIKSLFHDSCNNADVFYSQMISLPFHDSLTEDEIGYMINSIAEVLKQ